MPVIYDRENCGKTCWERVIGITCLIFVVYLIMGSRSTLWDRDEPRFCRATVEMIESGNYLYPTFNGELRPDKPILIYWLMSLPMRVLGPTELACRFFGAVGTALTALLTFVAARKLLGARAGLWAMVILAGSLMVMVIGNMATADAVLLPCMTAALAVFIVNLENPSPWWRHMLLMGLALGGALLAKGPVGLLPVLVMIVTLILLRKQPVPVKHHGLLMAGAVVIAAVIFITWGIPANNATNGEFFKLGIGRHVVERSATPMENHGGDFFIYLPYYIPVVIFGFFPWTLFLPGGISAALGRRIGGRKGRALFLGWTLPIIIVMTLVMTKLPHYILFMWPALAIATAGVIRQYRKGDLTERDKKWLKGGIWFYLVPAVLGIMGFLVGPWFLDLPMLRWYGAIAAIILLIISIVAVSLQKQLEIEAAARTVLAGMILVQIPFLFGIITQIEKLKISPRVVDVINEHAGPEIPVRAHKYIEPTLIFYLGREIQPISRKNIPPWSQEAGKGILVIRADAWEKLRQEYGEPPLEKLGSVSGLNVANGEHQTVLIYQRM